MGGSGSKMLAELRLFSVPLDDCAADGTGGPGFWGGATLGVDVEGSNPDE